MLCTYDAHDRAARRYAGKRDTNAHSRQNVTAMTNEINRGEPPYQQIARHYRELIERGELRPGHALPSVREMAQHWNVAHTTAARALKTLQSEGLASSTPGAGTVVSRQGMGPRTAEELAAHLRATGDFYPPGYESTILDAEVTPVLIERHWWTAADGTVLEYSESTEPGDRWRTRRYRIADEIV